MIRIEKLDRYTINDYYMNKINQFREYEAERQSRDSKVQTSSRHDLSTNDEAADDKRVFEAISNDDHAAQDMVMTHEYLCV